MVNIAVQSNFPHYSRFNVIVMCGGFDASGKKLYVLSCEKGEGERLTTLSVPEAHHFELIIYFVPQSLPGSKNSDIADHPPFEAQIKVDHQGGELYNTTHEINAWGGAAIKLKLEL